MNTRKDDSNPESNRTPAPNGKRSLIPFWIFLMGTLIAGLSVFFLYYEGFIFAKENPLKFIPAETRELIFIDLLAQSEKKLGETFGKWKNTDICRELRKAIMKKMALDITEDFLNWVGPRICIARYPEEKTSDRSGFLVVATIRDKMELRETIKRIESQYKEKYSTVYHEIRENGMTVYSPDDGKRPFFCLYKNFFLISNKMEYIRTAADTVLKKRDTIINSPEYEEICRLLPSPRIATLYYRENINQHDKPLRRLLKTFGIAVVRKKEGIFLKGLFVLDSAQKIVTFSNRDEYFLCPALIPVDSSGLLVFNMKYKNAIDHIIEKISRDKDLCLNTFELKLNSTLLRILKKHITGEVGLIVDMNTIFKKVLFLRKIESLEEIPSVLVVKLSDKKEVMQIRESLSKNKNAIPAENYRDHQIYSANSISFTFIENLCITSPDGNNSILHSIIDTRMKFSLAAIEDRGYKLLSEGSLKNDLLLFKLNLAGIAFSLKIISVVNPEFKRLDYLAKNYNTIWLKISGEGNTISMGVFLEDKVSGRN